MQKTPLDCWIASKIGLQPSAVNAGVNRSDLALYQLEKLRKIVDYAQKNSPFYARHLSQINTADHGLDLKSIGDIASLPFTTSQDLASHGLQMLCVSQSQIARVITLQTSGTTGPSKRIYFTEEDLELTADFFSHGMQAMVLPGDRVMVLMPGPNPGSVGERLATGLKRIGCSTVVYGLVQYPEKVIDQIVKEKIDCLIGLPAQVLSLARHPRGKLLGGASGAGSISCVGEMPVNGIRGAEAIGRVEDGPVNGIRGAGAIGRVEDGPVNGIRGAGAIGRVHDESANNIRGEIRPGRIKSVLLSADYVPQSIIEAIEKAWHCPVFTHWGMTETGLGGGVQCQAREGYHLREADLWIEIVDPKGGEPVPDGQWGEIVLTTLTRTGMPLIRYRTGDISRFMTTPCPCGSHLKRLDRVKGRSVCEFSCGRQLRLDALDEALFRLPDIIDFDVRVYPPQPCHALNLENKGPAQQADTQVHTQADTQIDTQAKEKQDAPHWLEIQFWTAQGVSSSKIASLVSEIKTTVSMIPSINALCLQGEIEIKEIFASRAPLFTGGIKRKIVGSKSIEKKRSE